MIKRNLRNALLMLLSFFVGQSYAQDTIIRNENLFFNESYFDRPSKEVWTETVNLTVLGDSTLRKVIKTIEYSDSVRIISYFDYWEKLKCVFKDFKNENRVYKRSSIYYHKDGEISSRVIISFKESRREKGKYYERVELSERFFYNYLGELIKPKTINDYPYFPSYFYLKNGADYPDINLPGKVFIDFKKRKFGYRNIKKVTLDSFKQDFEKLNNIRNWDKTTNSLFITLPKWCNGDSILKNKLRDLKLLPNLKRISLLGEGITKFPKEILDLPNLEILNIEGTRIKSLPSKITKLENLRALSISFNTLENYEKDIKKLVHLPNLTSLITPYDICSQKIPKSIANLKQLKILELSSYNASLKDDFKERRSDTTVANLEFLATLNQLKYLKICYSEYRRNLVDSLAKFHPNFDPKYYFLCFPEGSRIKLKNGFEKNIEDIEVDDEILALNETTKRLDTAIVTKLHEHACGGSDLISIKGEGVQIQATPNHPIRVNSAWKPAGNIKKGDTILVYENSNLKPIVVLETEVIKGHEKALYNISTTLHTYIVNNIIVHNK